MKPMAGVWIDHRRAVIGLVSETGEETMEIRSNVESQPGRIDGVRSMVPFESQLVQADDSHERSYTGHLDLYYERVFRAIRHAESVVILGPGEAKGEFKKHLLHAKFEGEIEALQTTDKLTDGQIMAKVRELYQASH